MSQDRVMNAFFLFTGGGSLVIMTSYSSVEDPALLRKLGAKGIEKFLAYQIPITLAKERYGTHFDIVSADLSESDDLRVLDFDGTRAFRLFHLPRNGITDNVRAAAIQIGLQIEYNEERLPISNCRSAGWANVPTCPDVEGCVAVGVRQIHGGRLICLHG
jgi:hypothetical protein